MDEQTKGLIDKYSPSQFVDKWSIPQLIVHGSKDYRLAETDSIAAFHALQQYVKSWVETGAMLLTLNMLGWVYRAGWLYSPIEL